MTDEAKKLINELKDYVSVFTDRNTAKRIKIEDIPLSSRGKKGSTIIKSPKSKKYTVTNAFNIGSKSIIGIMDGSIGYMKASDINIYDKDSVGSLFTKKNVDEVFVVTKYTDITVQNKEDKKEMKTETEEEKQEEPKEKQLTRDRTVINVLDFAFIPSPLVHSTIRLNYKNVV